MAVSKMQLINIIGPIDEFDIVARKIVQMDCFHPEDTKNVIVGSRRLVPYKDENPYRAVLKDISDFSARSGKTFFCSDKPLSEEDQQITEKVKKCCLDLKECDEKIKQIQNDISDTKQILEQAEFFLNNQVDLKDICNFKFVKYRFGSIPKSAYMNLDKMDQGDSLFIYIPTKIENKRVWGMYFASESEIEYVDTLLASVGFERLYVSDKIRNASKNLPDELQAEIEKKTEMLQQAREQRQQMIDSCSDYFAMAYTTISLYSAAADLKKTSAHSATMFYMSGWVEKKRSGEFCKQIEQFANVKCSEENPAYTKATVPTKMKNFALFRPFEMFVNMYGCPRYGEFDPTPLVAITYSVFFGIMFGDLGQGLVVALLGAILGFGMKKDLGKILFCCGISSAIFGTIFDSVFGYEGVLKRLSNGALFEYAPAESSNMMKTLLMAVGFGAVMIAIVMLINIFVGLRHKDFENALFGQNGVAGLVFYLALVYLMSGVVMQMLLGSGPDTLSAATTGYILGLIVLPLVLIFFKKPLGDLVSGKKDWFPKSFGSFLLETVFEMIEVLLSYITNTISFVRVGAFALSHSGMMYVVFLLAGTTATAAFGSGNLVVVVIGNLLIMGLEGLIVGIQVLRLEFYELFGRFYSGDGQVFTPVRIPSMIKNKKLKKKSTAKKSAA